MTGFGSAAGGAGAALLAIEIRTVNHRFFNPNIKVPASLTRWEGELRERLRQRVARGNVTLLVQLERPQLSKGEIDEEHFALYVNALTRLSRQHQLGEIQMSDVLRLPGVLSGLPDDEAQVELPRVLELLDQAIAGLDAMRVEEGARMVDFLVQRLAVFDEALQRVAARAPLRLREQQARLHESVQQLLGGVAPDEQRIAQEIAVMADRMDIAEEIGRLRSHVVSFRATLSGESGEPIGKRLGFILQEMLREVNTIGSKGADVGILRDVVLMKEELEKVREQAENIE
jgi:uncharacterized protein (TIGR00255 family)